MQIFDYVFVGAGTANLAAARRLVESDGSPDVLILERGPFLARRACPGVKPQACLFCERGCSILSGVGGTNALYGNKLCYFPASSSILQHFAPGTVKAGWQWLDDVLHGYFDSAQNQPLTTTDDLGRKHYRSVVLSRTQFRAMVEELAAPLVRRDLIRDNCDVKSIRRDGARFILECGTGQIASRHVVLGTGRAGAGFLRAVCDDFGVPLAENHQDVGIRVEAPQTFFSRFYHYQEDPKFKEESALGTMRTFCAENRGVIVPVMLDDAFFAEGAYPEPFSDLNNVALMVRTKKALPHAKLMAWCRAVNLGQGNNLRSSELTVAGATGKEIMAEIKERLPAMPTAAHQRLLLKLLEKLTPAHSSLFRADGKLTGKVRVFAPAIDNYWPRPEVTGNLETKVPGLFILGDAVGVSRGYVQALTAGASWATRQVGAKACRTTPRAQCPSLA